MNSRYDDYYDPRGNYGSGDLYDDVRDDGYEDRGAYEPAGGDYDSSFGEDWDSYDSAAEDYDRPRRRKGGRKNGARSGRTSASSGRGSSAGKRRSGTGRRRKRRRNSLLPVLAIVLLVLILGGSFGVRLYLDKYSYSKEKADLNDEYGITDDSDVAIVWGNEYSDVRARIFDGAVYMDLDSVRANLNDRFYYGVQNEADTTGMILYALPTQLVSTQVGSSEVSGADGTVQTDYVPARREGDTIYLALDFVKQYTNFTYELYTEPNRLQLDNTWETQQVATVTKDTQIRESGGIKSAIMEEVKKGDQVTVLDQMDTWSRVKSGDAILGYIENKRLKDITDVDPAPANGYQEPEYTTVRLDGKVNMAFHNVYSTEASIDTLSTYMAPTKTVNVLAPTWFWVTSNAGDMSSFASQQYVDTAHGMGLQVWAAVNNFESQELPDHNTFLTTLDSRSHLIDQLISECTAYGIDGINVDLEQIDSAYGHDYIEFIRELSIACRDHQLVLSVDDYPAYDFNSHYDIAEQGVFCDYVVIMGYDEHYAGSQEAGSVSSIGYVTDGIRMALDKVPKDKVINAVPFYSRIWKTQGGTVSSEAYGMQDIQNYISEHGMTVSWDAATGQNYTEASDGDTLVQIWVEDAQSLKEKLDVMAADDIAGVAEWKLSFETPDVWDVIAAYMGS